MVDRMTSSGLGISPSVTIKMSACERGGNLQGVM
jgi:hypothetical protein